MTKITLALFLIINLSFVNAAKFDIGISAVSNFQTKDVGAGFKIIFKPSEIFRIVPQVVYYPSTFDIYKYSVGLALELDLFEGKKHSTYFLVNPVYNQEVYGSESVNNHEGDMGSWALEGGFGFIKKKGMLRPFIEFRFRGGEWRNSNLRAGLVLSLSGSNNKSKSLRRHRCKTLSSSWS